MSISDYGPERECIATRRCQEQSKNAPYQPTGCFFREQSTDNREGLFLSLRAIADGVAIQKRNGTAGIKPAEIIMTGLLRVARNDKWLLVSGYS